jgi:hyperosmotically inducible protein
VINEINVLPLSQFDNDIRVAVYRSLFNPNSPLFRYGLGSDPSIHIIVENGKVTLKGVVSNTMDKQLAAVAANRVFGVFNVDNQLRLESEL